MWKDKRMMEIEVGWLKGTGSDGYARFLGGRFPDRVGMRLRRESGHRRSRPLVPHALLNEDNHLTAMDFDSHVGFRSSLLVALQQQGSLQPRDDGTGHRKCCWTGHWWRRRIPCLAKDRHQRHAIFYGSTANSDWMRRTAKLTNLFYFWMYDGRMQEIHFQKNLVRVLPAEVPVCFLAPS